MTTTIGSVDLNALSDLYNDANQYFWFESNSDATYGAGVHITLSPDTSFVANPSGQNVLMNTDGISIRNGLLPMMTLDNDSLDFNVINTATGTYNNIASFGSTAIVIGEEAKANLHLTFNNLSMVDKDGTKFFEVGDNRNAEGIATIKHTGTVSVDNTGSATVTVESNISSIVSVYADSVQLSSSKYSFSGKTVTINGLTSNSKKAIKITYTTTESTVYLTFGKRDSLGNIGSYSVAEGYNVISSAFCSHAEGNSTTASGLESHAEGNSTTASGSDSHAEGIFTTASGSDSHAEGVFTTASGDASHAEGNNTTASGAYSHAQGQNTVASGNFSHAGGTRTIADSANMTAIGKFNTKNSGKAFVVGNGTSNTARSDAFTVDWSGNTVMKGRLVCYGMAGEIKMWAGDAIPDGWLLCDGSEVSKTEYPNLYAAIGDLWGVPNSSSNFKLPNLNGRVPVGYDGSDTDFDTVGESGGAKSRELCAAIGACNDGPASLGYIAEAATTYQSSHGASYVVRGASWESMRNWNHSTPVTERYSSSRETSFLQPYAVIKYIICAI